jgi:DNA-binding IclR family transcriptional regulator
MAAVESFFVTRTMQALEVLAFQPASAPQIASVLQVDARTARRLLNRLTDEGWLVRNEGRVRTYTLSMRLVALAAHFAESAPLARAAKGAVATLHERTGGVAHLTVPSYRSVLCLVHRAGCADARPQVRELVPAHASAGGKLLLGYRDRWRESVLELPLERLTEHTIVDEDALREDCAACVRRRAGIEREEYRPGLQSVAAPVRDATGDVIAAVTLTGTAHVTVLEHLDAVAEAAADVEARLGEVGP